MNKQTKIKSDIKRTKDPVIKERLLMVHDSYMEPLRDVAKTFGYTHGKIDYWKKRYEEQGVRGLHTKPRRGRPPKITREQCIEIRRIVRKHNIKQGWQTQQVRELIVEKTGIKYCFRHSIRIVQSWGLSKIKPRPRYAFSKQEDRYGFIKKTRTTWHVNQ